MCQRPTATSLFSLFLSMLLMTSCQSTPSAPVALTGDTRVHDPGMIREDQTYYVFSTGDERGLNDGNIQIRKSTDLVHWELVGTVFERQPTWIGSEIVGAPPNLWAPDIAFFNDRYYLYYAGSRFGSNKSVIGLATNKTLDRASPDYAWVDEGMVLRSRKSDNWNAIDPNVAFDAAGVPWLAFGSFWDGIKLRRLDASTGKLAPEDETLYSLASRGGGAIEAPAIVYRDGFYYLFVSFDLCCRGANSTYKIMAGRSEHITGPYLDRDGKRMGLGGGQLVLDAGERFRGPGGQSVYRDEDRFYLVHHAYDATTGGMPQLQIRELTWTRDGWPTVAPY